MRLLLVVLGGENEMVLDDGKLVQDDYMGWIMLWKTGDEEIIGRVFERVDFRTSRLA